MDNTNIPEMTLGIYYYDESSGAMTLIPECIVDPVANTLSVEVNHFTVFSIYGQESLNALSWNLYQ